MIPLSRKIDLIESIIMTVPILPDELIRDIMYKYKGMQHPLVPVIKPFHDEVLSILHDHWADEAEGLVSFDEYESKHIISITLYALDILSVYWPIATRPSCTECGCFVAHTYEHPLCDRCLYDD